MSANDALCFAIERRALYVYNLCLRIARIVYTHVWYACVMRRQW